MNRFDGMTLPPSGGRVNAGNLNEVDMQMAQVLPDFNGKSSDAIESALEGSHIVFFEECPFDLPPENDLIFLRDELPLQTRIKNVSYHPETDSVPRFDAPQAIRDRVTRILKEHSGAVTDYLQKTIPDFAPGWTVGTCSFRPLEERGRNLKPRSSNEIVHIDAGAYGATGGARILRFFVNVNETTDRVWGTKGSFAQLFEQHEEFLQAARGDKSSVRVRKRIRDHCYSGLIAGLSKAYPLAKVIDSSPYDRAMRRVHNYMKETETFRADSRGYQEFRFPPRSAWMVFTDSVSHAVISGQHALVTTILIPLANCREKELAPYSILERAS